MAEIAPAALGLPARFSKFRPDQLSTALDIASSEKRFSCLSASPGSGKSLLYMTISRLLDARTLVLTATKGLQNQVLADFKAIGAVDVRGLSNYRCVALDPGNVLHGYGAVGSSCKDGPCKVGIHCSLRQRGCRYYDVINDALTKEIVIGNYAHHLSIGRYGDPETLGKFDLLVLDEGHKAPDCLTDVCAVELSAAELKSLLDESLPPVDEGIDVWASWARETAHKAKRKADAVRFTLKQRPYDRQQLTKHLLRLTALEHELMEMARARAWKRTEQASKQVEVPGEVGDWIAYKTPKGAKFAPIWSHQYSEELLFRGIPKVVLSSGTLMPSIVQRLGLPENQWDWHEVKSSFDPARRPIIYIPTTRVDNKMVEGQKRMLVNAIDRIVGGRLDRKGIIPSVSYDRANEIIARSKYGDKAKSKDDRVMFTHERGGIQAALEKFKRAKAPCVLVSPVLTEGIDLIYDMARYAIMPKVPFASVADPLFKARCKQDPNYRFECAALLMVQTSFRGMRASDDWFEVLILDEHFGYLRWKTSWPAYYRAAWRETSTVPPPLKAAA